MQLNIFKNWFKGGDNQEKKCQNHEKYRAGSTNDPILEAMQEKQPFEQAADTFSIMTPNRGKNHNAFFTTKDGYPKQPKDIYGNPIAIPDRSNPTRSSNERPIDTIRSFEYSITGDPKWKPPQNNLSKNSWNPVKNETTPITNGATTLSPKIDNDCNLSSNEGSC